MSLVLSKKIKIQKQTLLQLWEERVRREILTARDQPDLILLDSLPQFVDELAEAIESDLNDPAVSLKKAAAEHGQQRAKLTDYSLKQLIQEYIVLREVLFQLLEVEGQLNKIERDAILKAFDWSIEQASHRYIELSEERQRRVEDKRAQSEKEYRSLFDFSITGTEEVDAKTGKYLRVNLRFCEMTGYSQDELKCRTFRDITHPDDQDREWNNYVRIRDQGIETDWKIQKRYIRKDGSILECLISGAFIRNSNGKAIRSVAVVQDTFGKIEQEAVLHKYEFWLQSILDQIPMPMVYIDPTYLGIIFMNQAARNSPLLFPSYLPEDDQSRTFATDSQGKRISKEDLPRYRIARGETLNNYEMTWHSGGESTPISLSGTLVPETLGHPPVIVIAIQVLAERKKSEKQREILVQKLAQTVEDLKKERQLRENFVSTLTHDLKSPLTGAKATAQMLLRYPSPERIPSSIARVIHSLDRMDRMIEDLLDANRIEAGWHLPLHLSQCNLPQIVNEVIEEFKIVHGDRICLRAGDNLVGTWDGGALRRVLENLINNALKYGHSTQPITISLQHIHGSAQISVHNEGNPIPQSKMDKLFVPFHRLEAVENKNAKGWGIGLTLVRGLVEAHQGKIQADSSQEKGTTFTVILPFRLKEDTDSPNKAFFHDSKV